MGIEEGDDVTLDMFGAQQTCSDETRPVLSAEQMCRHRQRLDVVFQLLA